MIFANDPQSIYERVNNISVDITNFTKAVYYINISLNIALLLIASSIVTAQKKYTFLIIVIIMMFITFFISYKYRVILTKDKFKQLNVEIDINKIKSITLKRVKKETLLSIITTDKIEHLIRIKNVINANKMIKILSLLSHKEVQYEI